MTEFYAVIDRDEDGQFFAYVPELPGCHTCGETMEELLENLEEVIALEEPHLSPAMVLAELKSKVPADVWLTSAGVTATEAVTIKGVTYSYQSVARALFSLESSDALKDMKIGTVSRAEDIESDAVYDDFVIVGNLERRR